MKRCRFSKKRILAILKVQAGVPPADVCRQHGAGGATFGKCGAGPRDMCVAAVLRHIPGYNFKRSDVERGIARITVFPALRIDVGSIATYLLAPDCI